MTTLYEYQGKPRPLLEIARMAGMKPITLYMRIKRKGLTADEAVARPVIPRRRR